MKIERLFYGMYTATGKIDQLMSSYRVRNLISARNIEYIKELKPSDSRKYMWLPTEQTIAYPIIIEVEDKRKGKGGRSWVQNQTFIMSIHDYIMATQDHSFLSLVEPHVLPELEEAPSSFDAINV